MTARFADVLEISLAMSVVLAVLLALRPLLKKRLRAGAFYWVWLLAALRLCIPFNLSLPQAPVTVEAVPRAVYRVDTVNSNPGNHHYAALTEEEAASEEAAAENRPVDGGSIQDVYTPLFTLEGAVAALWLAGAGAFLAWHLAKYVRSRLRVRRWGAPAEDAALLARFEATPKVSLVTTDGFLLPNSELERRGLMARKGFPESYDRRALLDFISAVKSGAPLVQAPLYDHTIYDVVPDRKVDVRQPDVLVLEGLNVLQPAPRASNNQAYGS